jgi:monofunctional biosynthetic peptidoglycan transglycosylase
MALTKTEKFPLVQRLVQRRQSRRLILRLLRALAVALLLVLLLPYLLAPLYRVIDPVSTPMLWRWVTGSRLVRTPVPLERMAPSLPLAVIVAEDARFCTHHGVDWRELREAYDNADDLSHMRGGSTITQQLVKNLFLWGGRSYVRKALEFPLALWLDLVLPKRRVLEIYLNVAEWGPNGEFGAEAAARYAFSKSARDLTAREAALLAAILPNPRRRSARQPGPRVRRLAGIYESRAVRVGARAACVPTARAQLKSRIPPRRCGRCGSHPRDGQGHAGLANQRGGRHQRVLWAAHLDVPLIVCKPCFGTLYACRINPLLRTFILSCARPRRPIRTRPIQYR